MAASIGAEDLAAAGAPRRAPATGSWMAGALEGTESGGLHTPTVRGADSSVPVGVRAMTNVVLRYLGASAGS